MKIQKQTALKTRVSLASLAPIVLILALILSGCGGGGKGDNSSTASPTATAIIAGKVVITGTDDYTGVIVVAEKAENGVTARVQRMLEKAGAGEAAINSQKSAKRSALDTPGVYTTETDRDGNYKFASIPAGKYSISAYKESTLAAQPRIVEATTGEAVTVDFELVATGSVSGNASFGSTSGNVGIVVFAQGTSYAAYTDDAGAYVISNIPVGTYTITAMDPTGSPYSTKNISSVTVAAGQTTTLNSVIVAYEAPVLNEWLTIPAGDFIMGCAAADPYCNDSVNYNYYYLSERPKHTVTLPEYKVQKYEVTWFDYGRCVRAGVCTPPGLSGASSGPVSYEYSGPSMNYPVTYVAWDQAKKYCEWVGGRLPTEAEWEKTARGPSPSEVIYPWGNDAPTCSIANYSSSCVGGAYKVGHFSAGASYYGAIDMAGNAWEWVSDYYQQDYYASSPSVDPQGPATGSYHVIRGGSWDGVENYVRVSYRQHQRQLQHRVPLCPGLILVCPLIFCAFAL